jgi:hypothetical protein
LKKRKLEMKQRGDEKLVEEERLHPTTQRSSGSGITDEERNISLGIDNDKEENEKKRKTEDSMGFTKIGEDE